MGIRAKSDRHAKLSCKLNDAWAGINLTAILAKPCGIEFHSHSTFLGRLQKAFEKGRAILAWIKTEFFAEVSVPDDVEQTGFRGDRESVEICGPDFQRIMAFPFG